jgi:hypothetical protein
MGYRPYSLSYVKGRAALGAVAVIAFIMHDTPKN